jgi:2-C-methyl-D-erythritol 4-phosphate cytidylyltransferase
VKAQLILAAAGMGVRLGKGPKALVQLAGRALLVRTLERLAPLGLVDNAVILYPPGRDFAELFTRAVESAFPKSAFQLCEGGAERQISVRNALERVNDETDIVVIHDAARPFVPIESVHNAIDATSEFGGATVAVPVTDTILCADPEQFLAETPDRSLLWACQTPQVFRTDAIKHAHEQAEREKVLCTDDATLARRYGCTVKLIMGSPLNIKITNPEDLALAESMLAEGLV